MAPWLRSTLATEVTDRPGEGRNLCSSPDALR